MADVPQVLTWATLLASWADFAKSALAMPRDGEGGLLRQAVPSLIGLQALTHALAELGRLPQDERAVGLDRAEVLIGRYGADLALIWRRKPPAAVNEFVEDARLALAAARALHGPSA